MRLRQAMDGSVLLEAGPGRQSGASSQALQGVWENLIAGRKLYVIDLAGGDLVPNRSVAFPMSDPLNNSYYQASANVWKRATRFQWSRISSMWRSSTGGFTAWSFLHALACAEKGLKVAYVRGAVHRLWRLWPQWRAINPRPALVNARNRRGVWPRTGAGDFRSGLW